MKARFLFLPIILSAFSTAFWYYSYYLDVYTIHQSIVNNEIETFNQHVDYEKIKENLRAVVAKSVGVNLEEKSNNIPEVQAQLGTFGLTMINGVIEKMVQPKTVFYFVQSSLKADAEKDKKNIAEGKPAIKRDWTSKYIGPNEVKITFSEEGRDYTTAIFMHRYGFITWKITNLDIPLEKIAGR